MAYSKKINKLYRELVRLETDSAPKEQIRQKLSELGEAAFQENDFRAALHAYRRLQDHEKLKQAADLAVQHDQHEEAIRAYRISNNEQDLKNTVLKTIEKRPHDHSDIQFYLRYAFSQNLERKLHAGYKEFFKGNGFRKAPAFDLAEVMNAACELIPQYDVGVGVARGGLWSSYIFSLLDLPVIVGKAYAHGRERTRFKWHDNPDGLRGKRVLVLDKDVVTGASLRKTFKAMKPYQPVKVDVFLNHNPVEREEGLGSLIENVPRDFGSVWYPKLINYTPRFYDGLVKLEKKFAGSSA